MSIADFTTLKKELESRVLACTGSRVQNLGIELSPAGVRLFGQTATYHVKQLAQHCIRAMLPDVCLVNDISVS